MDTTVTSIFRSQLDQIRQGGLAVLFRKLCIIPLILLALPVVFLMRCLRPLVVIRIGELLSERLGHFAANTELYLCERDAQMYGRRNFDIFYYNAQVCNYQLKKMWDRILRVWQLAKFVDKANHLLPAGKGHIISFPSDRDIHVLFDRFPPHLSFTAQEEYFGDKELEKLGVPSGRPFVCFHARDCAYLDAALSYKRNWEYHNYRDSSIQDYILAAQALVHRGYFAIRMGAFVKERLNNIKPGIIDYAVNGRTDFLDIYLGGKCHFFISDTAGIYAIPRLFRRPIAYVNFISLQYVFTSSKNSLFIPKKLWLRQEKRFLTFSQILNSATGRFLKSQEYEQSGIEIINNTPEEIADLAVEMDERLKGKWQSTEEDECLQRRFWSLFKPSELNKVFSSRIGAQFLRQNQDLLG